VGDWVARRPDRQQAAVDAETEDHQPHPTRAEPDAGDQAQEGGREHAPVAGRVDHARHHQSRDGAGDAGGRPERGDRARGQAHQRQQVEGQERGALARELHDVVAHQLSLSTMLVMATSWNHDRETLRGTLDQVRRNTEAARSELDTLLRAMRGPRTDLTRPSPLVTATTTADTLAQRLLDNGHTPVMSVDAAADALDATTQRTLARIMQEATTNILRYAPAGSRCHFTLTVEDRWVRLTIASPRSADGHGSELSLGWGLRGIRERVELVRGTFRAGPQDRSWVVAVTLPVLRVDDRPSPRWGSRHGAEGVLSV
jgi:signal transduction histidine kinase